MSERKETSLESYKRTDIAVCPECGVLFAKTAKGRSFGLFTGWAYFCPQCDSLVTKQ